MIDDRERRRRLGVALQAARLVAKLEISEVSAASGVHRSTIWRAERGAHQLSLRHLEQLSESLGTKTWIILRNAEEKLTRNDANLH